VTGKPMDDLWLEYHDWLGARFAAKPAGAGKGRTKAAKSSRGHGR